MLGRVTLRRAQLGFVALVAASAVAGCATSPIGEAETLEQRAYAAYGTFVIAEENVEELTRSASPLSDEQKLAMVQAANRAGPVVDSTLQTLREYQAAKAEFLAGRAEQGTLDAVASRLASWVSRAESLVQALVASVGRRP